MCIHSLGATPELRGAVPCGLVLARVTSSQRDQYRLIADSGEFDGEPSGFLFYNAASAADLPVVGDWTAARIVGPGQAIVEAVLPRRSLIARRAPGRREEQQAIAANLDLVFLVCGLDGDFNLRRLERYLALASESRVEPVIVLNKADLCADIAARIAETTRVASGATVIAVHTRSADGIAPLRAHLCPGRTVALLGSSGVGKSSIVNRLLGEERQATAEVRADDSRGRHTTTCRELLALPGGGALIDTPGMRELQLWASPESVAQVFDEIAELARQCRYRDCTHAGEPGCAVAAALAEGRLDATRLTSFQKLRAEAERHDVRAVLERKRKWKIIHKEQRRLYKLPKYRP